MQHDANFYSELDRRKPDYVLRAQIQTEHNVVEGVLSKIFLPSRVTDQPYLYFRPTEEQANKLIAGFRLRFSGNVEHAGRITRFQANEVYSSGLVREWWGPDITESRLLGEPWDLTITTEFIPKAGNEINLTWGEFLLTACEILSPALMIERAYTGMVRLETHSEFSFDLSGGPRLHLKKHFSYEESERGGWHTFDELVAQFEELVELGRLPEVVGQLDDLLLLASLAARHRCVCLGWNANFGEKGLLRHFRRGIEVPDREQSQSQDSLIQKQNLSEFITVCFACFRQCSEAEKTQLRQSINFLVSSYNKEIESSILLLFSSLETLVALVRERQGMVTIFAPGEWKRIRRDLEDCLSGHSLLKGRSEEAKLLQQRLGELNRISFASAFQDCSKYLKSGGCEILDLWPVVGQDRGLSLWAIRSKIIHGAVFPPNTVGALAAAKFHLQWCVERFLLSLFGWAPSRSEVGRERLAYTLSYHEWAADQQRLASS